MSTSAAIDRSRGSSTEVPNVSTSETRRTDWVRTWLVVALVSGLVGLILRLGIVGTRDLWADEALTWRITLVDFGRMFHRVETDFHPPLHYLFMWFMQERAPDGWGPTYLRLANLLWFVGMGALAAWSARRPRLRVAVVPAFCVVAVAPGFVQLGAELRMYGMLLMLVSLALVALTIMVERPSWLAMMLAAVTTTAAAWTHYAGVIAGAAIIAAALLRGGRTRFRALAPVAAFFAAGVLTLIPFALSQLGHGIGYAVTMERVGRSVFDNLSVLGWALLILTIILGLEGPARGTARVTRPRSTEISKIALISLGFFALTMVAWYSMKGQIPINEGVSTIPVYLLLVGALGLRTVPSRTVISVVLLAGIITAGYSIAGLWGAPNYSIGKRLSHVDVLDEAIDRYPALAADGGRGWLIVEVDWADMNNYFRDEATRRLPSASITVATPAAGAVAAIIEDSRGDYQQMLVIRRPGTARVDAVSGYQMEVLDRWTTLYRAQE